MPSDNDGDLSSASSSVRNPRMPPFGPYEPDIVLSLFRRLETAMIHLETESGRDFTHFKTIFMKNYAT